MYTLVSAIGVPKGLNKRWQVITLTTITVAQLFSNYRRVQVTLTPPSSSTHVYLDLAAIASGYATYTGTMAALLTSLGSTALPTTTTGVVMSERSATFSDAFKAGYNVTPVDTNNAISLILPNGQLPNLRLSRQDIRIDYNYFQANCLVNVNGFYHRTSTDGVNGIVVKDGMKSLVRSGQNQVGIWSFTKLGGITVVPVTTAMVDDTVVNAPLINLGIPLTGKSVFMVLGGYYVPIDATVLSQVSGNTFRLNFTQIDLVNRYYESSNYIDLSSILVGTPATNPNQIVVADLTTATAVAAWLALSQTYFVVVNCAETFTQTQFIKRTGIPNLYISYTQPLYPLALALGRHPPYWSTYEDSQYAISIYDNSIGNLLYNTTNPPGISTSGATQPGSPGLLSEAYFIQVGSDVQ